MMNSPAVMVWVLGLICVNPSHAQTAFVDLGGQAPVLATAPVGSVPVAKIDVPAEVTGELLAGPPKVLRLVVTAASHPDEMRVRVSLPRELLLVRGSLDTVFQEKALNGPVTIDLVVDATRAGPYHVRVGLTLKWRDSAVSGFRDVVVGVR